MIKQYTHQRYRHRGRLHPFPPLPFLPLTDSTDSEHSAPAWSSCTNATDSKCLRTIEVTNLESSLTFQCSLQIQLPLVADWASSCRVGFFLQTRTPTDEDGWGLMGADGYTDTMARQQEAADGRSRLQMDRGGWVWTEQAANWTGVGCRCAERGRR